MGVDKVLMLLLWPFPKPIGSDWPLQVLQEFFEIGFWMKEQINFYQFSIKGWLHQIKRR